MKRYEEAAYLFKKSIDNYPEDDRIEWTYSYLGRCYACLEKYDKSLIVLSDAYDLFCKKQRIFKSKSERNEYRSFLISYGEVLRKCGQMLQAKRIEEETNELNNDTV